MAGQGYLLDFCATLDTKAFIARDRDDPLQASYLCFLEDFKPWAITNGHGFPVADINALLPDFLHAPTRTNDGLTTFGRKYGNTIGYLDGILKYFTINYESLLDSNARYPKVVLEEEYKATEALVVAVNADAPESVNSMIQTDMARFWIRIRTQQIYVSSAVNGSISGAALAFVVILIATRCIQVAFFATFTIVGILVSVLAIMVGIGWQLGTVESINITILAGFSVDCK